MCASFAPVAAFGQIGVLGRKELEGLAGVVAVAVALDLLPAAGHEGGAYGVLVLGAEVVVVVGVLDEATYVGATEHVGRLRRLRRLVRILMLFGWFYWLNTLLTSNKQPLKSNQKHLIPDRTT